MTSIAEKLAQRHFPENVSPLTINKLAGGISSEIYKIEPSNSIDLLMPVVLTVLRNPEEWWKLEKEQLVRSIIANDPNVLLPELIDFGFDKISGIQVAFLISEFIRGGDLDYFLTKELENKNDTHKLSGLAKDLGFRIGALHKHKAGVYGLVGYAPEQHSNWQSYIISEFSNEVSLISQLNPNLIIGNVKMSNLQKMIPALELIVGQFESSLENQDAILSHGDARFGNFMASEDNQNSWKVTSLIDIEAMLGGDPEIDIAFMENWLHFSTYKEAFFSQKDQYAEGYRKSKQPSKEYERKRFIYHILRSLAYLRTVFGFNIAEFVRADKRHVKYVEQHMQIIESLAKGNYLEDLSINSLI